MIRHDAAILTMTMLAMAAPAAMASGWEPVERVEHYDISGSSGIELYQAIGERGPKLGRKRVIAYTDFKLLWSRDYRRQPDRSCKLAKSRPSLTITYRLPRVKGKLPPHTQAAWKTFEAGIVAHEKVHGEIILEMVKKIEAFSTGLTVPDDPGCKKIREVLQQRLGELSQEQRARSRDFDRDEMSEGGNVHQLVLSLVNGG